MPATSLECWPQLELVRLIVIKTQEVATLAVWVRGQKMFKKKEKKSSSELPNGNMLQRSATVADITYT